MVSEASKYLGVPYKWGGTDPSTGLDCSGLTQLVYKNLGIDLPRTASQQATSGQAVASLADARPGDLVFFDYSSSRPGVDHVGVYIGNGKMIAAPQEGETVKVQDVGNPTVIRRILPTQSPVSTSSSGYASVATRRRSSRAASAPRPDPGRRSASARLRRSPGCRSSTSRSPQGSCRRRATSEDVPSRSRPSISASPTAGAARTPRPAWTARG